MQKYLDHWGESIFQLLRNKIRSNSICFRIYDVTNTSQYFRQYLIHQDNIQSMDRYMSFSNFKRTPSRNLKMSTKTNNLHYIIRKRKAKNPKLMPHIKMHMNNVNSSTFMNMEIMKTISQCSSAGMFKFEYLSEGCSAKKHKDQHSINSYLLKTIRILRFSGNHHKHTHTHIVPIIDHAGHLKYEGLVNIMQQF